MTKLKTPLLSLGAHGSIGNTLTFARRRKVNLVESKPIPINTKTLPQYYQRWLYQDYCAYWNTLSAATKRLWETNARPYHMTGFAHFMGTMLKTQPDIVGIWHLDETTGVTATDSSLNASHGTYNINLPVTGRIAGARASDGTFSIATVPYSDVIALIGKSTFTLAFHVNPQDLSNFALSCWYSYSLRIPQAPSPDNIIVVAAWLNGIEISYQVYGACIPNARHHYALTYDGINLKLWRDAILLNTHAATGAILPHANYNLQIGGSYGTTEEPIHGDEDELRIYNRALTQPELALHAGRRYPL